MLRKFAATIVAVAVSAGAWAASVPVINILPTPDSVAASGSTMRLPKKTAISAATEDLLPAARYLARALGGAVKTEVGVGLTDADISLGVDSALAKAESYRLTVSADGGGITVAGADCPGVVHGVASLIQLLPPRLGLGGTTKGNVEIACVEIADAPEYRWRGLHLDSSRHFWTVDEVKHLLDLMALYKLNVFHWHLIDDQGWRVEIKRYPELTEKGAWRRLNNLDRACEEMAAKSGNADMHLPSDRMKTDAAGDTIYGGYYTQDQLRDVVAYAHGLGIEVMPEFDVPGHSTMLTTVRPDLSCGGVPNSSVCPGKDATVEFCKSVFAELFDIFPSKYVHMGGDEVDKTHWRGCADCAARMAAHEIDDVEGLQAWFVRQMELYFRNCGRTLIGWDEIAYDGLGSESAIMWWRADNAGVLADATRDGKRVTCTPTSCMYFDYPQSAAEPGKILAFDPKKGLSARQQRLVNGMQANIWCEFIPTMGRIEYQIFPRVIALAESAWNAPERRLSAEEFDAAMASGQTARLDAMGVKYFK